MELMETLGLDDLGRTLVRTCGMEGDKAFICVTAVADCQGEIVHFETFDSGSDAEKLIARKVDEYQQYQKIRDSFNGTQGIYKAVGPNIQQLPKITADSITLHDDLGNVRVKIGRLDMKRHYKRKPQPNRGPIGRKEWT